MTALRPALPRPSILLITGLAWLSLSGCGLPSSKATPPRQPATCPASSEQPFKTEELLAEAQSTLTDFRARNSSLIRSITRSRLTLTAQNITSHTNLVWQDGDRFPTIVLRSFGRPFTELRLDPIMRSEKLHHISRIAVSPNSERIAVAAISERTGSPVLLLINRPLARWKLYNIAAYDLLWSDDHSLLVSVLLNQQPQEVHVIYDEQTPKPFMRTQRGEESLLLSGSRDGKLFFITKDRGNSASLLIYKSTQPSTPYLTLENESPRSRCTSWLGEPVCILFSDSPHGHVARIAGSNPHKRTILAVGSNAEWPEDLDTNRDQLVIFKRRGTNSALTIIPPAGRLPTEITPRGPVTTLSPASKTPGDPELKIVARSFVRPTNLYSVSELLSGSHSAAAACADCVEESLEVASRDGAAIPVSLVRPNTPKGLLILAYGAYGISQSAESSELFSALLEKGFAIAIAHVRGGGERGPLWRTQGHAAHKLVAVTDLLSVITSLQQRVTISAAATFLSGRSAGGWLVTKAALTKPELIRGLILDAPLLNINEAISNPRAPLYHTEKIEWGSTPLTALSLLPSAPLPFHILLQLPLGDKLINPRDSLRWAMTARCSQPTGYRTVLYTLSAGHTGSDKRAERIDWGVLQEAFITTSADAGVN